MHRVRVGEDACETVHGEVVENYFDDVWSKEISLQIAPRKKVEDRGDVDE
jgi:hypothetical protein